MTTCASCHRSGDLSCSRCKSHVCYVHAWFTPKRTEKVPVNAYAAHDVTHDEQVLCLGCRA